MTNCILHLVAFCRRFALFVVVLLLSASIGLGFFIVNNIAINTDIDQLMATDLVWRQQEKKIAQAFPQNTDRLVIVLDSKDPDLAENAANKLSSELQKRKELFKRVSRPDAYPYFLKNGLLFLSEKELSDILDVIIKAQPMLGSLSADPSLRGLFRTMNLAIEGLKHGEAKYEDLAPSFSIIAQTLESNLAGKSVLLPWQSLFSDRKPSLHELRKFIVTQPIMDFDALSPGAKASEAIRQIAQELGLTPENGVNVRLTGSVALNDEEFASVAQGAGLATGVSLFLVMFLLFLALRSVRLILPIIITLLTGLVATTAFALAAVGSLNLISVAFAVMFIGVAVDFGIQFGVRYRETRHACSDETEALRETARAVAAPLSLAAGATALGLISFMPTDYRGVAELGLIAGVGILIAFILNVTLLPALLTLFRPPPEPKAIGYKGAAALDDFLVTHRKKLLPIFGILALVGLVFASQVRFDFDPLNLKNPDSESVSTLFDIMKDPDATIYTIEILANSLEEAQKLAQRLDQLDQVDHTLTLESFIPQNQEAKLALIEDAKFVLDPSLYPLSIKPAPTQKKIYSTLKKTAYALKSLEKDKEAAHQLARALEKIVQKKDPRLLTQLDQNLITGIKLYLAQLRARLSGTPASIDDIDSGLRRNWITPDGRAKIEVYPKGNARNYKTLAAFTKAVRQIAPQASGAPISIQESGKTVMGAFLQAGLFALGSIFLLLIIVLKKISDVLRILAPLILAGILTLATMFVISLPLNFANVIALPLLLSLGVSYAIYFVTYWKSGKERPLSSGMARAVMFSAATTLVAFFSLSLSSHIGTRSMGQLLTIALIYCLSCSFLLLPVLLGRHRLR